MHFSVYLRNDDSYKPVNDGGGRAHGDKVVCEEGGRFEQRVARYCVCKNRCVQLEELRVLCAASERLGQIV